MAGIPYMERLAAAFAGAAAELPGARLNWLAALRRRALERAVMMGLPTQRMEAWKYTSLKPAEEGAFLPRPAAGGVPDAGALAGHLLEDGPRLVFVDGVFVPALSRAGALPDGVSVSPLTQELDRAPEALRAYLGDEGPAEDRALWALNTAFMAEGAVLRVARGSDAGAPIHIVFLTTGSGEARLVSPRLVLVAEAGSSATVVESHVGLGRAASWTNLVCQAAVGRDACLTHLRLQQEGPASLHTAVQSVKVEQGGRFETFTLSQGAALARHEIDLAFRGQHASARLDGVQLGRGRQHLDTATRIVHDLPACGSEENWRTVLDDDAHGVFQGLIRVARDAQKTEAHMHCGSLLMSDGAQMDEKPELEILANDVQCSHGATAGDIDDEALFYLRSRGVGEAAARGLLVEGYVGELIEGIACEPARALMRRALDGWLPGGRRLEEAA